MIRSLILVSACVALTACGPKECVLTDASSCPSDQVGEAVTGRDEPLCFAPITLKGKVFDLSTAAGIEKADVLATDENGAPAGTATVSAADGTYTLRVPSNRTDEKGAFASRKVMLRSQAKNYLPFPSGARVSLPNPGLALRPGMSAWIEVQAPPRGVAEVPTSAVLARRDRCLVFRPAGDGPFGRAGVRR